MKIKSKFYLRDQEGQIRLVSKFLLFPRRFQEKHWRWFTTETIVEQVCKVDIGGSGEWGNYAWRWCEQAFADSDKGRELLAIVQPEPLTPLDLVAELSDTLIDGEGEGLILLDGFEEALLGYATRFDNLCVAAYDKNRCLQILMNRNGMDECEAEEFFDYNVIGAWMGVRTPIFVTLPL